MKERPMNSFDSILKTLGKIFALCLILALSIPSAVISLLFVAQMGWWVLIAMLGASQAFVVGFYRVLDMESLSLRAPSFL